MPVPPPTPIIASTKGRRCSGGGGPPRFESITPAKIRAGAGLPDSSPLRRRKFELATVRGTAYAGPKLGRRDVRQTTVRTAVVVVVAPRLEGGFQILKTEEPM